MKIIFDYNRTLFNPDTQQLFDGVLELLEELCSSYELLLVSRNEPGRGQLLKSFGIERFFKKIAFVDEKTPELFLDLSDGSKQCIVVGDRALEEIKIGAKLGYTTIWLRQGKFADELPSLSNAQPDYVVRTIGELRKVISII